MKKLKTLLQGLPSEIHGNSEVEIEDIVFDSRKVKPGALFVALQGVHQDGRRFVQSAVESGARAVLMQGQAPSSPITTVAVPDALQALADISVRFWDRPSQKLRMVAITGTNGKTTTSYLVESIFEEAGWHTGVMGTINYRFGSDEKPAPNTTPFASDIQRFLDSLVRRSAAACVMEVSSHALALSRVSGIDFDVAVFTNLTQDHLDFHKTMEEYAAAKMLLFASLDPKTVKPYPRHAVINADDPWAEQMVKECHVPILRFGLRGNCDIRAQDLVCDASGSRFQVLTPIGHRSIQLPLLGEYNVSNALAAIGVGISQGLTLDKIAQGLEKEVRVPGRMERFVAKSGFSVVVDYAHTEDALRKVMGALKRLKPRRLVTVFGCGGDRDRAKRPLMGEAAAEMSDYVIVTSDNPRSEDPARITLDIEVGVRRQRSDHYEIVLDRESAIARAIGLAQPGDIILLAGKGHENYQILADRTIPFDDRAVTTRLLASNT